MMEWMNLNKKTHIVMNYSKKWKIEIILFIIKLKFINKNVYKVINNSYSRMIWKKGTHSLESVNRI